MNWNKWIIELLPLCLRNIRIYALLKVFCHPVRHLYERFVHFKEEQSRNINMTPTPRMLERIVSDQLKSKIIITEDNGKPYDFMVNMDMSDVNMERKILTLIDQYKMAGKKYRYQNEAIAYEYEWGGFLCERIGVNHIILEIHRILMPDILTYAPIYLKSDFRLISDLTIKIGVKLDGHPMSLISISAKRGEILNKTINDPDGALVTEITEFSIITPSEEYDKYYDAKIVEI